MHKIHFSICNEHLDSATIEPYDVAMPPELLEAAFYALPTTDNDLRLFLLGCVGRRNDGKKVRSKNGAARISTPFYQYHCPPLSHAESRLLRKLGKCGIVYVARVSKENNNRELRMARPCVSCRTRLMSARVKKVYYTIDNNSYGMLVFRNGKEIDTIFSF